MCQMTSCCWKSKECCHWLLHLLLVCFVATLKLKLINYTVLEHAQGNTIIKNNQGNACVRLVCSIFYDRMHVVSFNACFKHKYKFKTSLVYDTQHNLKIFIKHNTTIDTQSYYMQYTKQNTLAPWLLLLKKIQMLISKLIIYH